MGDCSFFGRFESFHMDLPYISDPDTCAAPQLPAPCTGCLVHASAMNMPEWRLEVARDPHGQLRSNKLEVPAHCRANDAAEVLQAALQAATAVVQTTHTIRYSSRTYSPRRSGFPTSFWSTGKILKKTKGSRFFHCSHQHRRDFPQNVATTG